MAFSEAENIAFAQSHLWDETNKVFCVINSELLQQDGRCEKVQSLFNIT